METCNQYLANCMTIFGGFIALVLLGITIYQIDQQRKERKNQYLIKLFTLIYTNDQIMELLYRIDKSENLKEIRFGGNLEKQADATLKFLNLVGYLLKGNIITLEELDQVGYELKRFVNCKELMNYSDGWLEMIKVKVDGVPYLRKELNK